VCAFTSLLPQEPQPKVAPALIVRGALVYTGTDKPWPGTFEARWGRIVNPGEVLAEHHRAQVVELDGAFLVPGLQDAHGHLLGLGTSLAEVNLVGTRSFDEVI